MVRHVGVLLALTALALTSGCCCKRWCCAPACCPPACCSPCCSPCCKPYDDGVSFYPPPSAETAPPPMPLPAGSK